MATARASRRAVRLGQVFSNLLSNAAKFTQGGRIWLSADRRGDEIFISIKDNGIGIKAEMLPRLFEIFSQAEPLYERSHEGLGIGLWLVKSLVEMHGGSITALSEGVDNGSEFIVRLPVITSSAIAESGRSSEDNESEPGKVCYRILVVDDRKNAADMLARLLRKRGHEVHTANDGREALLAAEKSRPKVVLLDIGMPGMNRYEACRQIRSQPWGTAVSDCGLGLGPGTGPKPQCGSRLRLSPSQTGTYCDFGEGSRLN